MADIAALIVGAFAALGLRCRPYPNRWRQIYSSSGTKYIDLRIIALSHMKPRLVNI
jgi:hypothetical protein